MAICSKVVKRTVNCAENCKEKIGCICAMICTQIQGGKNMKMYEIEDQEEKIILGCAKGEKIKPFIVEGEKFEGEITPIAISADGSSRIVDLEKEKIDISANEASVDLPNLEDNNGRRRMFYTLGETVSGTFNLESMEQEDVQTKETASGYELNKLSVLYDDVKQEDTKKDVQECKETIKSLSNSEDEIEMAKAILEISKKNDKNIKKLLGIYLSDIEEDDSSLMLNFTIRLLKTVVNIQDTADGETKKFSYHILITVQKRNGDKIKYETVVDSNEVKKFIWVQRATHGLAQEPQDKQMRAAYASMVQNCIETEGVPREIIYPSSGWRNLDGQNYGYVVTEGIIGRNIPMVHADKGFNLAVPTIAVWEEKSIFDCAFNMTAICSNRRVSTLLFLYYHMGLMNKMFQLAGYPICFVTGVIGATNSRKTSMVTTMLKLFNRKENLNADAEFTSTSCGIESILGKYGDSAVIIDDFRPGETRNEQRALNQKLTDLVRLFGNRVEKKRMTCFSKNKQAYFPIRGVCVITGELVAGCTSTLLRMFMLEINRDDVDNVQLGFYQKNTDLLPKHTVSFVTWLTDYFESCIQYIESRYPHCRSSIKVNYGRYADMYAAYMVTAELFSEYAYRKGFWDKDQKESFLVFVNEILRNELYSMDFNIKSSDGGSLIIKAIFEMLKYPAYMPLELNDKNRVLKADFYEDADCFYIKPDFLKLLVSEYCKKYCIEFVFTSANTIIRLLEDKNVLKIHIDDKGNKHRSRKLSNQQGNARTYLYLKKEQLQKVYDNIQ